MNKRGHVDGDVAEERGDRLDSRGERHAPQVIIYMHGSLQVSKKWKIIGTTGHWKWGVVNASGHWHYRNLWKCR